MALPVILKGGKNYLTLVLDAELPFPELLSEIISKFLESEKFFKSEPIAIMFEGRDLSSKEQLQIMDAIDCYTSVRVAALVENDRIREYAADEALRRTLYPEEFDPEDTKEEAVCTFIPRTVETGEQITSDNTIVVSGNVEAGAIVSSTEHVVVLGALYGQAICGTSGDENSHIIASVFAPENFRIGETLGPKIKKKKGFSNGLGSRRKRGVPQIAYLVDGEVQIEDYTKFI